METSENEIQSEAPFKLQNELLLAVESLLKPDNLAPKAIFQNELSGTEYFNFIENHFKLFEFGKLPEIKSLFEVTIEYQLNAVKEKCFKKYKEIIEKRKTEIKHAVRIPTIHNESVEETLKMFDEEIKMGNYSHEKKFKSQLEEMIDNFYIEWKKEVENILMDPEKAIKRIKQDNLGQEINGLIDGFQGRYKILL